jgi:hypothetical protein
VNLFDHLTNLTATKVPFDSGNQDCEKSYVPFIINRFVSMCDIYLPLANEMNRAGVSPIPKETHYQYYWAALPHRRQYFEYLKKAAGDKDNRNVEEAVMWFFKIGRREARERLHLLKTSQTNQIVTMYDDYTRTGSVSH